MDNGWETRMTTETPWPAPLSPRLHEYLISDEDRQRALDVERIVNRMQDRVAYAASQTQTIEQPRIRWQPRDLPAGTDWDSAVREWVPAPIPREHTAPRHVYRPDVWIAWSPVDFVVAALLLLAVAVTANTAVIGRRWYVAANMWLALHERQYWTWIANPRPAPADTHHVLTWTAFPTAEWPGVVGQWTREEFAVRTGAQR